MAFPRLPIVGGDNNAWGDLLNKWLTFDHSPNSTHKPIVATHNILIDPSVNRGDVVYFDSGSSSFKQAVADGSLKQKAIGFIEALDTTTVVLLGIVDTTAAVVPGTDYYLSPSIAGGITSAKPPTNIIKVGTALTTSILLFKADMAETMDTSTYSPVRTFGSAYQPDTSNNIIVQLSFQSAITNVGGTALIRVFSDSTPSPTTQVASAGINGGLNGQNNTLSLPFIVGKGNYYQINKQEINGTVTSVSWIETQLKM